MRIVKATAAAAVATALVLPASAGARLPPPGLVGPANGGVFQQLPSISWQPVRGAAEYEYEISADPHFNSIPGSGLGKGTSKTHNLAAALDQAVADGTYSWRVRAVTSSGTVGAWSAPRRIIKWWTVAPQLIGGDGAAVDWPTVPLVLRWSPVPYAVKYIVTIASDPALSNVVLGSAAQPAYTAGTSFVLSNTLANGTYYWAITPIDAEGHRGSRSRVATFTWTWPTATRLAFANLDPTGGRFDPVFSWDPIPGAARYDVEVNQDPDFPGGSKWCCSTPTIGTSLAPQQPLPNNSTYWWRVRAVDAGGNAGQWNYGAPFTKAFDAVPGAPTIPNLTMRDTSGNPLSGVPVGTNTPLVTWGPVPGASRYEVQVALWNGTYCDFSSGSLYHAETATTAWTPLGKYGLTKPGPTAWPFPQTDMQPPVPGYAYCVRVLARADDVSFFQQVVSDWTYINAGAEPDGGPGPAFYYDDQPAAVTSQPFQQYVQTGQYLLPATGSSTPRTPYFTWRWLPGARSYWVVIAKDRYFTDVADLGLAPAPAYAPRLDTSSNGSPLADKDTAYYWAVIPAPTTGGAGFGDDDPTHDQPQSFNKTSVPPLPIQPQDGASISTWPEFRWTPAENARNYTLQVSQDPSFGNLIDNVTTDDTAYTSSSTYPADAVVYWRVRANDWTGQGLNWSPVRTFTRRLAASSPMPGNPTAGDGISVLAWNDVAGAVAYDVHIDQGDGTTNDYTVDSTAFAPTDRRGIGTVKWQVRPLFPTNTFGNVGGPFFAPQPFLLTLSAPTGARGVKSGSRVVISWNPDPAAKQYEVEVSTTDSFSLPVDEHRVDGTSWAPDIDFSLPANRGQLFWRVAAVDSYGTVGSYATGNVGRAPPPTHKHKPKHRRRHKRPHKAKHKHR